jgi:UDP-N-acetylmuramoylalanine--D-glutamate ligase
MERNIVILGAGESGTGAALLAMSKGKNVFVSDSSSIADSFKQELIASDIEFEENGHSLDRLLTADLIIKSPGIPDSIALIEELRSASIPIIDELEFASRYTQKPIIAITGSNGKTTTTLLTHHLLVENGINAALAGNVGHSMARQVIADEAEIYVVEVSSFQLDGMKDFAPDTAAILNITPDHLDRYNYDFEAYAESKMKILQGLGASNVLVYCSADENLSTRITNSNCEAQRIAIGLTEDGMNDGFVADSKLVYQNKQVNIQIPISELPIRGPHNYLNALVAIAISSRYGLDESQITQALSSFKNAPHRLELFTKIGDVDVVNDSKATNVEAVLYALGSFDKPIIWIAGGQDKGNDYSQIKDLVAKKVKAMVCLGVDNHTLLNEFGSSVNMISETKDVKEAAKMALEYANNSDVILFSPACASFDLFNNYAERGELFKSAVLQLKQEIDA